MATQLEVLLTKIKEIEDELILELQKQEEEFFFEVHKRKVSFADAVVAEHKQHVKHLGLYFKDAPFAHLLSAPLIWLCLFPFLALDVTVSLYHAICFPLYGIPKVKRADYLIFDRRFLNYLNLFEKINCFYCSYANGLIAYVQEIAARTEQFWCPIKHARRMKQLHSRYRHFLSYGDAANYRANFDSVRRNFEDLH